MNFINPKVTIYKRGVYTHDEHRDGFDIDLGELVDHLPNFPGSDKIKKGFKSFFD